MVDNTKVTSRCSGRYLEAPEGSSVLVQVSYTLTCAGIVLVAHLRGPTCDTPVEPESSSHAVAMRSLSNTHTWWGDFSRTPRPRAQGRLDFNTEGLLLLTNDGDLARWMELPSSNIVRTYSVRVYGNVSSLSLSVSRCVSVALCLL